VPTQPLPLTGKETGIDVGLKGFLLTANGITANGITANGITANGITANGQIVENPRHSRKAERELKQAQQRVSKRKQGRRRRKKAVQLLAKQHQHVRRQRTDFQHNSARALVGEYDVIYVEAIQPANVSRRPAPKQDENGADEPNGASRTAGLNKRIQDAGWRHFLAIRAYKAAGAGKRVEAVRPASTSQDCAGCGARIQTSLSVRTQVCTNGGLILDRDDNAARNLLWRGQRLRGVAGVPAALNREPVGLSPRRSVS